LILGNLCLVCLLLPLFFITLSEPTRLWKDTFGSHMQLIQACLFYNVAFMFENNDEQDQYS
jgi:hypothetical protein